MRAADDADFIKAMLDQRAKERADLAACTCTSETDAATGLTSTIRPLAGCAVHGGGVADPGDIALGFRPGVYRLSADDLRVIDVHAIVNGTRRLDLLARIRASLAAAGYRIGKGPDPVTGKCG